MQVQNSARVLRRVKQLELKDLIQKTYLSEDSNVIRKAEEEIDVMLREDDFQRFDMLEQVIEDASKQEREKGGKTHFLSAAANIYAIYANKYVRELQAIKARSLQQYEQSTKAQICNKLEHYIDNEQIQAVYKQKITTLFVHIVLHHFKNIHRFCSKLNFFDIIDQKQLVVMLLHSWIDMQCLHRDKDMLYLEMVVPFLDGFFLQFINATKFETTQQQKGLLNQYFQTFQRLLQTWNLKTHREAFLQLLAHPNFEVFCSGLCLMTKAKDYANRALEGLCKLLAMFISVKNDRNIYRFAQVIQRFVSAEFNWWIQAQRRENEYFKPTKEKINLFCKSIQSGIFLPRVTSRQIFTYLLTALYEQFYAYICLNYQNSEQIYNFLKDASYEMKSQILPTLLNKLLFLLCINDETNYVQFKEIIKVCLEIWSDWRNRESFVRDYAVEENRVIQIINVVVGSQVKMIIRDQEFILIIEKLYPAIIEKIYEDGKGDEKSQFFILALYENYMDDIWIYENENIFTDILLKYTLQNVCDYSLNQQYAIKIFQDKLSLKYPFKYVEKTVNAISNFIHEHPKKQLLTLYSLILRRYVTKDTKDLHLAIMNRILTQFQAVLKKKQRQFFGGYHEVFNSFFGQALFKVERTAMNKCIFELLIGHRQEPCIQFGTLFSIFGKNILTAESPLHLTAYLPYISELQLKDLQSCQFANYLLMQQSPLPTSFLSLLTFQTLNNPNPQKILLLHNLIIVHHSQLSLEAIKYITKEVVSYVIKNEGSTDFVTGKIMLVFMLILKYRFKQTMITLKDIDQQEKSQLIENFKEKIREVNQLNMFRLNLYIANGLTSVQELKDNNYTDVVLILVYFYYKNYRIKYDIPMFIGLQTEIFLKHSEDFFQKKFATVTLLALLSCLQVMRNHYKQIQEHKSRSQNNQNFLTDSKISVAQSNSTKALEVLIQPFFNQFDWLAQAREFFFFIKNTPQYSNWFNGLLGVLLVQERVEQLEAFTKNSIVQSSVRYIRKVSRKVTE